MTKTYTIIGGTGFLGQAVVSALIGTGHQVRSISRKSSVLLEKEGCVQYERDILQQDISDILEGCDGVFHFAGVVSRDPKGKGQMMELHVNGTRRVVHAAVKAGVPRIVVSSSSGTIAVSKHDCLPMGEDTTPQTDVILQWPYYCSKWFQERLAFDLGEKLGIDIVCINPSLLLGPGDWRLSSTKDVMHLLLGKIPIMPGGGISFVDVRDAAKAAVTAMEKGKAGKRYLLGGPNWTMSEFLGRLSRIAKVDAPVLRVPKVVAKSGAFLMEHWHKWKGTDSPVDAQSVELAEHFWYVDSSLAKRELDFTTSEPSQTLFDTVQFLQNELGVGS